MRQKVKTFELSLIFGLCLTAVIGFSLRKDQETISSKIIRLHVVANSDTAEDQELKLAVRDRVIELVGELNKNSTTVSEAGTDLMRNLKIIEDRAQKYVWQKGYPYLVKVSLMREEYTTREYDTFTLPAGMYNSLRVLIGEGEGKNWWCVVFPPLCYSASEEFIEAAETAGLSKREIDLIVEDGGGYIIKFKLLEYFQRIVSFFS